MANQKSIRVEKVGIREFRISGYTRPYTAQLMAAGAEWQGRELYWRYTGDMLPASIQNIIIGQFSLMPETPMTAILDEPAGESGGKTTVVNFKDVMEYWDKTRQKWTDTQYVYIGRAMARYGLPQSRWANSHVMQDENQRQQVIEDYRQDLLKMDRATLRAELKKLTGKTLVCWCKKTDQEVACHGDVLVEFIANPPPLEVEAKPTAYGEPAKPQETTETKQGAKLRELANKMQHAIDHDNRPYPFDSQPPTRKRVNEYLGRKAEALRQMQVQDIIRRMADAWDARTLPNNLKPVTSMAAAWRIFYDRNHQDYETFMAMGNPDVVKPSQADRLEEMRLEVALKSYDDYFPTSMKWLQDNMIEAADIQQGDIILEPSAGTGHLAQAIREAYPDNELHVIEIVPDFRAILAMQGFNLTLVEDFLQYNTPVDVIIQNPPFSRMEDIDHVYHAFKLLKPGGRLVSIMSMSPFFNSTKKAETFRKWFNEHGGYQQKLPDGAFKDSERSTGVATCMIVMRKPKEATESPSDTLTEISIMKAPQALVAVGTMPDFVEAMPERQPIVALDETVKKPDVTTVEGAAQILYGPKAEDAKPLTYDDYKRVKSLYPDESQIVMLHVGAMWTTWDDDAETLEMALKASQKGVRHPVLVLKSKDTAGRTITMYTADLYIERFEEAVKAAKLSLIKVNKDGSVRVCNTLETTSQSAQNVDSSAVLVVAPHTAENAKNDVVAQKLTALVSALKKPAPESEIPFIALYISGSQNVGLLFEHYVEAIRLDDPDMKLSRAKQLAAAALLYQYQQEWASMDVETQYPAIFEAFKAAAKGEILISMLLRISGLPNIVELTYDDTLMEHIVDVVAQTPF